MAVISILICDDHPVVRRGLKEILESDHSAKCVEEASTAQEALDAVRDRIQGAQEQYRDLVLLDISLPGKSGLEALKELKRARPRLPILVVSMHSEEQYAVRALKAGAAGYLSKKMAPEELVNAVNSVLRGRRYVTERVADRLIRELGSPSERHAHENLSDREHEVTCLIAEGKSVQDIADELMLSVKTVSTYRLRSLVKLGLKSNAGIIRYALEHRLVHSEAMFAGCDRCESPPSGPESPNTTLHSRARLKRPAHSPAPAPHAPPRTAPGPGPVAHSS